MERDQPVDAAGPPADTAPVIPRAIFPLLLACALSAQQPSTDDARRLFENERWPEVIALAEATLHSSEKPASEKPASEKPASAELEYFYGVALARLNRLDDARQALLAGSHLLPRDKRFPIELAGVSFRQKRYAEAAGHLRRALRLDPHDTYAGEFLATVYFLEGNLEAAAKYWNRSGKPVIAMVRTPPALRVNPELLDRSLAFSPASVLRTADLLTTEARLRALEIFPGFRLELNALPDATFDVGLRARELNRFGGSKLEVAAALLSGLPYQEVRPEYFNIGGEAVNFVSLVRWDSEKRRAGASLSGPVRHNPVWRYRISADLRNENWDLRDSLTAAFPVLASLNLRRAEAGAEITRLVGSRLSWSAGARVSHRDYRNTVGGGVLTPSLLAAGYGVTQTGGVHYELLRIPERRFTLTSEAASEAGRIWSGPGQAFGKLQASLAPHWFPRARGDDYETSWKFRAGKTWGAPPFDELFMLGLERDNDLTLRGHAGTRRGRKGSAPLGRSYFLENQETDKNIYGNGIVTFKLGPFLDAGRIGGALFPDNDLWLCDAGIQAKLSVLGTGVVFSWGRDLRAGRNVFYARTGR